MIRSDEPQPEVFFTRSGQVGHITLNRPKSINALTHGMVHAIQDVLDEWADDPTLRTVLLTGSGDRGLCAGGDILSLYRDATTGDGSAAAAFFRDEYRLNASIASYSKPYVAIMDGLVLGGGIGLSAHGSHRIVTERSKLGMPETGIGFVPDVGGTWLLSHAPGELGTFLALTAGSVRAGDAIALGLADSFITSDQIPALIDALTTTDADPAIAALSQAPPASNLTAQQTWIDRAYAGESVPAIIDRLRAESADEALVAAESMSLKSPTALVVTLASLRSASRLPSLEAALEQEYRVSVRAIRAPDFIEGVRAQVVDKDRQPRWSPPTLDGVDGERIASFFAPLEPDETQLTLPDRVHGTSVF
ncbi:enoyl-CoA hydratase/isomerase family protein [Cryobacterium sp. TMS1-20-1]|uniref:enoyl-CoA hydratase/isomerase family protein n=1 Tax=Cryobacterium sp. TMS1-20-1 TaxID=1259223 RepID=UPI00106C0A0A|nr:enoyl-CoA hydratase/isomerase family protein [Cryobacterium sp. TMS1-20-1]TFC78904.1 enoyl-CoA hydratase/isomerase family protein [Cryobacterium sp. TMS1-20-1]